MRTKLIYKLTLTALGLASLGLLLLAPGKAAAANPTTINFQGKVVNANGTNVADSTYSFVFKLYTASSGGSAIWTETDSLATTSGVFQVNLGASCPFFTANACNGSTPIDFSASNSLYLGITFNSDPAGEMSPRVQLQSIPYSFYSDNSGKLGGLTAGNFVQLAQSLQTDSTTTNGSIAINKTGASGDILLLEANSKTALQVNNSGATILGQAGASGLAGTLTFQNATDSSTATISFTGNSTASYTYLLPSTSVGSSQCLQSGTVSGNNVPLTFAACSTGGGYTTIDNSGSSLTQRTTLNFTGNAVSCTDNSGSSRTDCTVAPTLQNAYDNSSSPATILTSSSSKNIVLQSGSGFNSTGLFQIQNATSGSLLNVDSSLSNISLLSLNDGQTSAWTSQGSNLPSFTQEAMTVAANGYVYIIGGCGCTGYLATVQRAKLNADGTTGAWITQSNGLPAGRIFAGAATANGYIYIVGGDGGANGSTTVYYAKINPDGSTGGWNTASSLPVAVEGNTSVIANGYIYSIGGNDMVSTKSTVNYAKLNADGSLGPWITSANSLPAGVWVGSSVVANGYVYVLGGDSSAAGNTPTNNIFYAKLNADGSTGAWTNQGSNQLPAARDGASAVVSNGYVYVLEGSSSSYSSGGEHNTVFYAKLNANGSTGPWTNQASNLFPIAKENGTAIVANGNILYLNGEYASAVAGIYHASLSTVKIGGNLDLTSVQGSTLADGGDQSTGSTGGSITAGNITAVGSLSVLGYANFSQGLYANNGIRVDGGEIIRGAAGSTNIDQVQNAGSDNLINVTTVNLIGNSSFEAGPTNVNLDVDGWHIKVGTETSLTTQASNALFGSNSMQLVMSAANNGVTYPIWLVPSQQYTFSFYAKISVAGPDTDLSAGRSDTGISSGDTDCTLNSNSITNAYARYTCTFTTGATIGASGESYIYIRKTATARTIYIDGVQLETGGSATAYRSGDIAVSGLLNLQPATFAGSVNQNAITQTIANQTTGTVSGYSQSITVSNASSTTATNGLNISISDSASGLHNTNDGITISLSGSNTGQIQYGIDTNVNAGVGIRGTSSGNTGSGSTNCFNGFSGTNFSAGVCGITSSSSAASYGGFFVANSTSGTALYASNYTSSAKILDLQNNTSSVFSVASGGLITLQPAANLTSGQTELAQTFTNGSSTGGTVNGYSQTITVNNTSSASTTNGISIALTDATSLANIDVGLNVDLTGITNSAATKTAASFTGGSVIQTSNGPVFQAGADATSTIGSGTGNEQFNQVVVVGKYAYAVKNGDATTCAGSSGSFIGCELQIYDVTNAKKPKYIGGADSTGATNNGTGSISFNAVFVSGRYAYVVANPDATACSTSVPNGCEVKVFDISKPSAPTYVGGADDAGTTNSGTDSAQALTSVFVSGRYLYTGGTDGGGGGCGGHIMNCQIKIWDISNPAGPTLLSYASDDGTTNGGGSGATGTTNSIYVSGRYMYTGSSANGVLQNCSATAGNAPGCELKIWDVSNPASPTYLGGATDNGNINSGTNTTGDSINSVYVTGRYAYTASAGFTSNCTNANGIGCELKVWDITTPGTPVYVSGADASGTNSATGTGAIGDSFMSLSLAGRYAYVSQVGDATACSSTVGSGRGCELKIFDVGDPTTPTYLGGADASGSTNTGSNSQTIQSIAVSGRYLYDVSTGNATACSNTPGSGIGCEFQIYDLTGVEATTLSGGSVYAGTIQVASSGQVAGDFNIQGSGTVGQNLQINGNLSDSGQVLFANTANSTAAFQVQNSSGVAILGVDTSGSQVLFGTAGSSGVAGKIVLNTTNASSTNVYITTSSSTGTSYGLTLPTALPGASNYCIVSTNLGALSFSACGAGSTATVTLTPEYPGAVLTPANDGFTHTGTMTSDFCGNDGAGAFPDVNTTFCASGQYHNYYAWTANATNYYDVWVRWQLPSDFASFSSITFNGWTSSTSDAASLKVYKAGTVCGSAGSVSTSATWGTANPGLGSCSFSTSDAGSNITFDADLKVAVNSEYALAGEITIVYNRQ